MTYYQPPPADRTPREAENPRQAAVGQMIDAVCAVALLDGSTVADQQFAMGRMLAASAWISAAARRRVAATPPAEVTR